jgi:hypothetical protein
MAKGDWIEVAIRDIGPLTTTARQNGRKVTGEFENEAKITWFVVREVTRGGTLVHEARYQVDAIVSIRKEVSE